MRGVNLGVFDFDYDLTWAGFFVNANEVVLGRYGSRTARSAESQMTLEGLRYAMQSALTRHREDTGAKPLLRRMPSFVDDTPAAKQLSAKACIHCHQVYDFRRDELQRDGKWSRDDVWVYPFPENVGLTLEVDQGNRVTKVTEGSAAARAGLRAADVLEQINDLPVASIADVQYALHRAPAKGEVPVSWLRANEKHSGTLSLAEGWRKTDVSWRWSLRSLEPLPCVQGVDLDAAEKKALGLPPQRLAFRQAAFVHPAARQAGLQAGDVILGVENETLDFTARQFTAHLRLTYNVGDVVRLVVVREGKQLVVPLKLPGRGASP
jgi:predicted metalloprotease with PDZ domain